MFGGIREKERVLGGGERKTKLRRRGSVEAIVSLKPNMSLFISRVLTTYYLFYLFIFIILSKRTLLYFLSNE